jgi:hypothetical protein
MTASITAMWATIILAALGAFFAGPGLGVLAGILGTTLVVVLAMREEDEKARDARRRVETLLTSDEAVDGLVWESPYGLQRHTARRMLGRACRSLRPKAPKEDRDA